MAKRINKRIEKEPQTEEITIRESNDYINNEVKDYAFYVIRNRATLHIMDGLRTGARKIIYGSIDSVFKGSKKSNLVKYNKLFSGAFDNAYEHGDSSLKSTIEQFSSRHITKLAPFITEGQIPKLRDKSINVAPRYLEVKASKYLDLYATDLDLCELNFEENKLVEPKFMLPILPMALIYRTSSPGFGFGYSGFSYNLYDVINAVNMTLINGSCTGINDVLIKPDIYGLDKEKVVYNTYKKEWYNVGEFEIKDGILYITDLPYHITDLDYANMLTKLEEKGFIKSFFNNSSNRIDFTIEFHPNQLETLLLNKSKFYNTFSLIKKVENNNYNFIDTNDKIIMLETPNQVVEHFVKRRLEFYEIKRKKRIKEIKEEMKFLNDMVDFINAVISEKLIIFKRTRKEVLGDIKRLFLNKDGLELRTTKFTLDGINEIKNDIESLSIKLNILLETDATKMYLSDIIDLMKTYFRVDEIVENKGKFEVIENISEFDEDGYYTTPDDIETPKRKRKTVSKTTPKTAKK